MAPKCRWYQIHLDDADPGKGFDKLSCTHTAIVFHAIYFFWPNVMMQFQGWMLVSYHPLYCPVCPSIFSPFQSGIGQSHSKKSSQHDLLTAKSNGSFSKLPNFHTRKLFLAFPPNFGLLYLFSSSNFLFILNTYGPWDSKIGLLISSEFISLFSWYMLPGPPHVCI